MKPAKNDAQVFASALTCDDHPHEDESMLSSANALRAVLHVVEDLVPRTITLFCLDPNPVPSATQSVPPQRARASKQPSSPKGKRRSAASEEQDTNTVVFAPTLTPGTFFDPPAPEDRTAPAESLLFPDLDREESPAPTRSGRGGHAKKKPEDHVPRPPNSFILFRSAFIWNQHVSATVETNHSTLSAIIGCTWKGLPKNKKAFWHRKAKEALEEHERKFPGYTFRPLHNKGKRLQGHIAEFDRNHIPEIVTSFEAPITTGSFRLSSSASLPENASSPSLSDEASEKKTHTTSS
ncbi:uncharacterized protein PHACADRAFT_30138 [Phanerochaete carnosa HHB-10118-sp]|uniref:HMG box domain-containing protein n=1 Tax=Phanerochaete carnosa (strain HHB-10118-sp) TaxID=650164 RepID=K5USX5_PHACS|nr:uncharacterized protein PHACADRAFT_30138 [Phanerochaete carnosa HHB-10118-sp]EKM53046.1 hypothetical protein PHACADRAFT_30138 [Phanerochaete carnosa HHB-10118-sp]